jgi:YHS domain-containing protein
MILRILQLLVILAVIRAVWRLFMGILEGAGYRRDDRPVQASVKLVRDPICGTFVSPSSAPALRMEGQTWYFCSDKCKREWERR